MDARAPVLTPPLVDPFGRAIRYVRVSVTDRCDFRCAYCMSEDMNFLPKREVLSLEELDRLCSAFVRLGARKLRVTGGEPLVRRDVMTLFRALSRHLDSGALDELTLTTNGSQLARFAAELFDCGVRRVNVSLDTLDPAKFRAVTRWGDFAKVMGGIDAADAAGLKIKINAVALKGFNDEEAPALLEWAHARGFELTFIEVMPLGEIERDRFEQFLPLTELRAALERRYTLTASLHESGGPARYFDVAETGGRLGFITPLTHNFCERCNRVRVTCTGRLYLCLGHDASADLRAPLRRSPDDAALETAIREAIRLKPQGHDFIIERAGSHASTTRHMSATGG
jgi:cyclic pyranopterin phosphate synthase